MLQGHAGSSDLPVCHPHRAENNFLRCCPAARGRPNPSCQRGGNGTARQVPYFVPATTWTHDFFLLDRTGACLTPGREEAEQLRAAGLGHCMQCCFLGKRRDRKHAKDTLEKCDPKLFSQNGAFQLMQCLSDGSGVRELSLIPMVIDGYPVPVLKEDASHQWFIFDQCRQTFPLTRNFQIPLMKQLVMPYQLMSELQRWHWIE